MKRTATTIILLVLLAGAALFIANTRGENQTLTPSDIQTEHQVTTPEGLVIRDTRAGGGREAKIGDLVVVHYAGVLDDGTVFDSSVDRNQPFAFKLGVGSVIPGWELGIPGMRVGGIRTLVIPPELAYGDTAVGGIPPNSTLIFSIELLDITEDQEDL